MFILSRIIRSILFTLYFFGTHIKFYFSLILNSLFSLIDRLPDIFKFPKFVNKFFHLLHKFSIMHVKLPTSNMHVNFYSRVKKTRDTRIWTKAL